MFARAAVCIALVAAGAVLVGLFVRRQLRLEGPLLRFEVLRSRRYRTSFSTVALIQAILIGLNVLMPLYIQNALGFSATVSGMITLPGAVLGALAGLAAGRLFDRSGIRGVGLAGAAVLLAGGLGMFAHGAHSTVLSVVVAHAATSVGLLAVMTPVNTWGMNSLDNDLVQHATAVSNAMNQVGGSLGTALIMSFSALGTSAAFQGTEAERAFAGYHLSFAVVLVLAAVVVLEMATVPVVSVTPDVSFEEACRILADRRLKELPVVEDGRLVGTLHRRSLMQAVASLLDRPAVASES